MILEVCDDFKCTDSQIDRCNGDWYLCFTAQTEVLQSHSLTRSGLELMTSKSWQHVSYHWDAHSNHLAKMWYSGHCPTIAWVRKWTNLQKKKKKKKNETKNLLAIAQAAMSRCYLGFFSSCNITFYLILTETLHCNMLIWIPFRMLQIVSRQKRHLHIPGAEIVIIRYVKCRVYVVINFWYPMFSSKNDDRWDYYCQLLLIVDRKQINISLSKATELQVKHEHIAKLTFFHHWIFRKFLW